MDAAVSIDTLYKNLEQQGVEILHCPTREVIALAEPEGYLCLNPDKVETAEQEREILIHEEGHFATDTFYQLDSPYTVREHQENIASRHGFKKYFSVEKLLSLMDDGYTEPWQLAEQLGVRLAYVQEMLDYYTDAQGVDFGAELAHRHEERETREALEVDPITEETAQKLGGLSFSCDFPLTETAAQEILALVAMCKHRKNLP